LRNTALHLKQQSAEHPCYNVATNGITVEGTANAQIGYGGKEDQKGDRRYVEWRAESSALMVKHAVPRETLRALRP
jgi:hypothetical protein